MAPSHDLGDLETPRFYLFLQFTKSELLSSIFSILLTWELYKLVFSSCTRFIWCLFFYYFTFFNTAITVEWPFHVSSYFLMTIYYEGQHTSPSYLVCVFLLSTQLISSSWVMAWKFPINPEVSKVNHKM